MKMTYSSTQEYFDKQLSYIFTRTTGREALSYCMVNQRHCSLSQKSLKCSQQLLLETVSLRKEMRRLKNILLNEFFFFFSKFVYQSIKQTQKELDLSLFLAITAMLCIEKNRQFISLFEDQCCPQILVALNFCSTLLQTLVRQIFSFRDSFETFTTLAFRIRAITC